MEMLMANAIDAQVSSSIRLSRLLRWFHRSFPPSLPQVASTPGKSALAMEAFARALRQLPTIIADNAGLDSSELVTQLRAAHTRGETQAGLDINGGTIGNMWELGIRESYKSKLQVRVTVFFFFVEFFVSHSEMISPSALKSTSGAGVGSRGC